MLWHLWTVTHRPGRGPASHDRTMAHKIRKGYWLHDHPPKRGQGRTTRRSPGLRPVIVVHSAESPTDLKGQDTSAEGVCNWITQRSTAGAYHIISDRDSIIPVWPLGGEVWGDGTGSNRWAVQISVAMKGHSWPKLSAEHRDQYLSGLAKAAQMAADHMEANGLARPAPVLLTKAESERRNACGFISHGRRDPGRRSDPGRKFPWKRFFEFYMADSGSTPATPRPPSADDPAEALQTWVDRAGVSVKVDGDIGPKTIAAATEVAKRAAYAKGALEGRAG